MRKVITLFLCIFLICGCQKVSDMTIEELVTSFSNELKNSNVYRVGYKFYLPSRMQIDDNGSFTEIISSENYNYYLYVDIVSYYNEVGNSYKVNETAYYSEKYIINDKISYLEINITEYDKYLIEFMYNYAKIEVMVDYDDINEALINAVMILNNIVYNDEIIENYLVDDVLNFTEEIYDIFSVNDKNISQYELKG